MAVNAVGAATTFVVLVTLAVTKFFEGAWIVLLVIPVLISTFRLMYSHYDEVATALSLDPGCVRPVFRHTVLILVGDVHRCVVRAVAYATTLAPTASVRGVFVETDPARRAPCSFAEMSW